MRPEEAQVGKRVRVRMDYRRTNLRGKKGTIAKRWSNLYFTALDVLLDDGTWQLFWYHGLEEVNEDDSGLAGRKRSTMGTASSRSASARRSAMTARPSWGAGRRHRTG